MFKQHQHSRFFRLACACINTRKGIICNIVFNIVFCRGTFFATGTRYIFCYWLRAIFDTRYIFCYWFTFIAFKVKIKCKFSNFS
ncbi:hypothetical protein appser13_4800 [Actinobacillus pleuropneumoniae serovar 13 str. N273]|nr:hypothetical protein appser13_4800 [Actinobacillus pleuropneumoniae serovar 13 str. N273]